MDDWDGSEARRRAEAADRESAAIRASVERDTARRAVQAVPAGQPQPVAYLMRKRTPGYKWPDWQTCSAEDHAAIQKQRMHCGLECESMAVVSAHPPAGTAAAPRPATAADPVRFFWENRPTAARRALDDVMAERHRQMMVEGWTARHDDEHSGGSLAIAGAAYALAGHESLREKASDVYAFTGWAWGWWKPKDRRRNLVRAAALVLAEIERLDRALLAQGNQEGSQP